MLLLRFSIYICFCVIRISLYDCQTVGNVVSLFGYLNAVFGVYCLLMAMSTIGLVCSCSLFQSRALRAM